MTTHPRTILCIKDAPRRFVESFLVSHSGGLHSLECFLVVSVANSVGHTVQETDSAVGITESIFEPKVFDNLLQA